MDELGIRAKRIAAFKTSARDADARNAPITNRMFDEIGLRASGPTPGSEVGRRYVLTGWLGKHF